LQLRRDGKNLDAQKAFQDAIKEDPNSPSPIHASPKSIPRFGYDGDAEQASARPSISASSFRKRNAT